MALPSGHETQLFFVDFTLAARGRWQKAIFQSNLIWRLAKIEIDICVVCGPQGSQAEPKAELPSLTSRVIRVDRVGRLSVQIVCLKCPVECLSVGKQIRAWIAFYCARYLAKRQQAEDLLKW